MDGMQFRNFLVALFHTKVVMFKAQGIGSTPLSNLLYCKLWMKRIGPVGGVEAIILSEIEAMLRLSWMYGKDFDLIDEYKKYKEYEASCKQ